MAERTPCPFCGGRKYAAEKDNCGDYRIMCSNPDCGACGPIKQTKRDAGTAWRERQEKADG